MNEDSKLYVLKNTDLIIEAGVERYYLERMKAKRTMDGDEIVEIAYTPSEDEVKVIKETDK